METSEANKACVCLIEVKYVEFSWRQPWQRLAQQDASGTGFILHPRRILTNAHVVAYAIDLRVRLHGSTRRFAARTVFYAPDVDLALLEVKENPDDFFQSRQGLQLADALPALQERVHVTGFPTGGRTICVTEGVVSRISSLFLSEPSDSVLAIQIDAAINAGNSGGPVFNQEGKVTGVAFCKSSSKNTDNIGYVLAASVVNSFLGRCGDDGVYTLSPSVPYSWHTLENASLRLYHEVPESISGILLTDVSPSVQHILHKNDVLVKIDGKSVSNDGQVVLRGSELIQHRYLLRGKNIDEPVVFTVFRNGESLQCEPCVLKDLPTIYRRWPTVDHKPDYLILGALVLIPCSYGIIFQNGGASTLLKGSVKQLARKWPGQWDGIEEMVILSNILASDVSFAYYRPWRRVLKYNDTKVVSLAHLRDLWEASCKEATQEATDDHEHDSNSRTNGNKKDDQKKTFARIELEFDEDIVFEVKAAMEAQDQVLKTHSISKLSVTSPPNPKYRS